MKTLEQLEAVVTAARDAAWEVRKPFDDRIKAIEVARDLELAPYTRALERAEKAVTDFKVGEHKKRMDAIKKSVTDSIPSPLDFKFFAFFCKGNFNENFLEFHSYGIAKDAVNIVRAPKVEGLTLLVISEGNGDGNRKGTRYYGAWSNQTRKLVGLLSVEPSRHPGDSTQAYAEVNNQPVKFEEDSWTGVKNPVATFLKALENR